MGSVSACAPLVGVRFFRAAAAVAGSASVFEPHVSSGWLKGQDLWVRVGRRGDQGTIFVVRRALGTAVKRNRLKRRLRSICREIGPTSVHVVVLPLPSSVKQQYRYLRDELEDLLSRLNDGSD